ncbi:MAG: 4-(cytidine 5'-diphospho)-2-C-methyl-D-erythritol kinase [Candidatus Acetothermia bacterium]
MKLFARSFAKVNPYLEITGTRRDGYHELEISYLSVNLDDRLTFESIPEESLIIETESEIPREENLCYRVAKKLQALCSVDSGARIILEKRIPIGGGLGGGSSDAATTLIALNRLWKCGLSRNRLIEIGGDFGADIPFFFYGGYCKAGGTGDLLQRLDNPFTDRLVPIIAPPFSQLTGEVYSEFDRIEREGETQQREGREKVNEEPPEGYQIRNDLQEPALRLRPEISEYLEIMERSPLITTSGLSGSGSAVFGITEPGTSPEAVKEHLQPELSSHPRGGRLEITRPTKTGQVISGEGE